MDACKKISRLALGTAQFGSNYGISNRRGLIPKAEVFEILKFASGHGIDTLDTAQAYGTSETVIGEFLRATASEFKVITKLKGVSSADMDSSLRGSLSRA